MSDTKPARNGGRRVTKKRKRAQTVSDAESEGEEGVEATEPKKKIKKEDKGHSCSTGSSQKIDEESNEKNALDAANEKDMEKKREAETALKFMEDHFTCALCVLYAFCFFRKLTGMYEIQVL